MDFIRFYQAYKDKAVVSDQFERFVNNATEIFGNDNTYLADRNRIAKLFRGSFSKGSINKSQYFKNRKLMIWLYEWLYQNNAISDKVLQYVSDLTLEDLISHEELQTYYFKDLDSAIAHLDWVAETLSVNNESMLLYKIIVILSWHQLDVPDIIRLKKDSATKLKIPQKYLKYIYQYIYSEDYIGFPGGSRMKFIRSDYLIRTSRKEQLTANNIHSILYLFNKEIIWFGKQLNCPSLEENGLFNMIYTQHLDRDASINQFFMHYCKCDKSVAYWKKKKYLNWKKEFDQE